MKQIKHLTLILAMICSHHLASSQTMGVVQSEAGSLEGYTFFSPFSGTKAWMVDNCGRIVNSWDRGTRPGLAAYFLDNGLMFRTYKPSLVGPFTSASNSGGIELVDWDNNTVWSYEINTPTQLSHHDAVYMPNGNILILTWELVYTTELIDLGRDPNEIAPEGYMWSERILELEPVGTNDANIVWEWSIRDHYIQDFDSTKMGFGVVAEHPELFNINLPELNSSNSNSTRDWNHFNAIDYNPALDQILLSVRNSDEIWILDHSTSTAEAASHTGGNYGKGGDILYRWGNASAYNRAPVSEQKLFGQHGVHWIKEGLDDAGKIMIYNNGNGRPGNDYSTVEILEPPQDANGAYILSDTEPFEPANSTIVYGDETGEQFYSAYLSNAQHLSNGNTLINAGSPGNIFEIDQNRNIVWRYIIPLFGDFAGTQGNNISNNGNFRAYKFAADFAGFDGIDLEAGETIEEGDNPLGCMLTAIESLNLPTNITTYFRATERQLVLENPNEVAIEILVSDMQGRQLFHEETSLSEEKFNLQQLATGMYVMTLFSERDGILTYRFFVD